MDDAEVSYFELIRSWQQSAILSSDVMMMGDMVIEDAQRILALTTHIKRLEKQLGDLLPQSQLATNIASITGFGLVCSTELAAEIGTMQRFSTEASLARYIGIAPLDNITETKGYKQVNRRAKAAMMVAAARHYYHTPQSKAYYDKKRAEGKKHNQAVRSLARHLSRVIWSLVKNNRLYEKDLNWDKSA